MSAVLRFLSQPFRARERRRRLLRSSILDHPPPPVDVNNEWDYGPYSFKATCDAVFDKDGKIERSFYGYSQNMDITNRTKHACERHKRPGTTCTEPVMTMKGGESEEVIFMKTRGSEKLQRLLL